MADEGDLYTGIVPANEVFANEQEPQALVDEKRDQRAELEKLLPSVEVIRLHIQEEREAVSDLRSYLKALKPTVSGEEIRAEYRARELYIGYLSRLENDILNRVTEYKGATSDT